MSNNSIIIFLVIVGVAFLLNQIKGGKRVSKKKEEKEEIEIEDEESLFGKYLTRKEYLMTYTEKVFFTKLQEYLKGKEYMIFSKVRLVDLVDLKDQYKWEAKKVFNIVRAKHIDFVITDLKGKIIACIELDDYRHDKENRNDNVKNNIMKIIGLNFTRFKVEKEYDFTKLSII